MTNTRRGKSPDETVGAMALEMPDNIVDMFTSLKSEIKSMKDLFCDFNKRMDTMEKN